MRKPTDYGNGQEPGELWRAWVLERENAMAELVPAQSLRRYPDRPADMEQEKVS